MQILPFVYVAFLGHTDVDAPPHEDGQEFQVVPLQSLCVQLLHNVVKNYMAVIMITLVMNHTINMLLSNLHLGNINIMINLRGLTMTTTTLTTGPMKNRPRPSGNPGVNGKTIPRPPTTHTRQVGSTTPSPLPRIQSTLIHQQSLHPNLSRHSLPITPLIVTATIHVDQALYNLVAPSPLSLQDMFPSTSKMVRETSSPSCHAPSRQNACRK